MIILPSLSKIVTLAESSTNCTFGFVVDKSALKLSVSSTTTSFVIGTSTVASVSAGAKVTAIGSGVKSDVAVKE